MPFCLPASFLFFLIPTLGCVAPRVGVRDSQSTAGILLELVEGKKMGFHPCVYTQNTQFFQENQIMDENQIGPNINTTPMHKGNREGSYPSG